jgi:hypothetical protein
LTLKSLVQQIDAAAENWLPLKDSHDENIVAWAELHGWDASEALIRQVDELIEALLGTATSNASRSSLPIQLRLLETGEDYELFCT